MRRRRAAYRKVSHAVGVVYVKPDNVHRVVKLLEHALHSGNVILVFVVPSAVTVIIIMIMIIVTQQLAIVIRKAIIVMIVK